MPGRETVNEQAAWEARMVDGIRNRRHAAFTELMEHFRQPVFRFAYSFFQNREDAMEIVQETFLRVYQRIDRYREKYSLRGWIYCLTHNLCIDYYRKYRKRQQDHSTAIMNNDLENLPHPQAQDPQQREWQKEIVAKALAGLPAKQRSVFILRYLQGWNIEEIALALNISKGTVKTNHFRALQNVRRRLGADLPEEP